MEKRRRRDKQNIKTTDWLTRGMTEAGLAKEKEKEKAIKEAEAELRDKQIAEMARIAYGIEVFDELDAKNCREDGLLDTLLNLYNAGYRKSQDFAEEIFAEISKASADWGCYCISAFKWGYVTSDVSRTLAELKKKYTEER